MNVTVRTQRERDGEIGEKASKAERGQGREYWPALTACPVQKCWNLMGDKIAQPPEGCTSNYAT